MMSMPPLREWSGGENVVEVFRVLVGQVVVFLAFHTLTHVVHAITLDSRLVKSRTQYLDCHRSAF